VRAVLAASRRRSDTEEAITNFIPTIRAPPQADQIARRPDATLPIFQSSKVRRRARLLRSGGRDSSRQTAPHWGAGKTRQRRVRHGAQLVRFSRSRGSWVWRG